MEGGRGAEEVGRGAGFALGGGEVAGEEGDAGEVGARDALHAGVAEGVEGVDGGELDAAGLIEVAAVGEHGAEGVERDGGEVVQAHALGVGVGGAQGFLGAGEVAQVGEDDAELGAQGAGVPVVAGGLERGEREREVLAACGEVAVVEGADSTGEREERASEHVEGRRVGEGGAVDGGDRGVGVGVVAAEAELAGALAEAGDLRAPGARGRGCARGGDGPAFDAVEGAELAGGADDVGDGAEPRGGSGIEQARGLDAVGLGGLQLAAPHVGLGLDEAEAAEVVPVGAGGDAALGAREGGGEVVRFEGLLGRAAVPADGARGLAAAPEVLGHGHGVGVARPLHEAARETVAEGAVGLREHGVRGVAHHGVAEDELDAARARGEQLARRERGEGAAHVGHGAVAAEERRHALHGEAPAEHARGAEDALGLGPLGVAARLHEAEHRVGEHVAAACGDGADELAQVEGVAAPLLDDAADDGLLLAVAERVAHQALARAGGEGAELDQRHVAPGPRGDHLALRLGASERDHHEGQLAEVLQGGVDEAGGGPVAPLQVFEHQEHRLGAALGDEPLLPRGPHGVAHQERVAPRGDEDGVGAVRDGDADHLPEEGGDAGAHRPGEAAREAGDELGLPHVERLALADAGGGPDDRRDGAEGGPRGERVGAAGEHLERLATPEQPLHQLAPHAGLPGAGGARHERGAGHRLGHAAGEDALEHRQLAVAAHAGRLLAEQERHGLADQGRRAEDELALVAVDLEAAPEHLGGGGVDPRDARARGRERAHAAIDHLALDEPRGDLPAPRDDDDGQIGEAVAHGEGAERGALGAIDGGARGPDRDDERAAGERGDVAAVRFDGRGQIGERHGDRARDRRRARLRALGEDDGDEPLLVAGERLAAIVLRLRTGGLGAGDGHRRRAPRGRGGDGVDREADLVEAPGTRGRVLREHARHEIVEERGDLRAGVADARRRLEQELGEHGHGVVAVEGGAPDEALVQHAAEREDVRARVERRDALHLLRRDVAGRAQERAGLREPERVAGDARDPEVDHGEAADVVTAQEQVRRLEVAVHGAGLGGVADPPGGQPRAGERLGLGEPASREAGGEVFPFEPLHRQVVLAALGEAVPDVADDVGVVELREDGRLADEALDVDVVGAVEDLQRHGAAVAAIRGAEDRPHASRPRLALEEETAVDERSRDQARPAISRASYPPAAPPHPPIVGARRRRRIGGGSEAGHPPPPRRRAAGGDVGGVAARHIAAIVVRAEVAVGAGR